MSRSETNPLQDGARGSCKGDGSGVCSTRGDLWEEMELTCSTSSLEMFSLGLVEEIIRGAIKDCQGTVGRADKEEQKQCEFEMWGCDENHVENMVACSGPVCEEKGRNSERLGNENVSSPSMLPGMLGDLDDRGDGFEIDQPTDGTMVHQLSPCVDSKETGSSGKCFEKESHNSPSMGLVHKSEGKFTETETICSSNERDHSSACVHIDHVSGETDVDQLITSPTERAIHIQKTAADKDVGNTCIDADLNNIGGGGGEGGGKIQDKTNGDVISRDASDTAVAGSSIRYQSRNVCSTQNSTEKLLQEAVPQAACQLTKCPQTTKGDARRKGLSDVPLVEPEDFSERSNVTAVGGVPCDDQEEPRDPVSNTCGLNTAEDPKSISTIADTEIDIKTLKTTVRASVSDPQSSSNHGNSVVQPEPAKVLNNNTSVSSAAEQGVDSLLHYSPPCRMVESLNNNHSVEEKDDDMRTFSLLQDTATTAATTTTTTATTIAGTDAKISQECATVDDQSMQEVEAFDRPEIVPRDTMFEGSVEHKNNSNHARQDFFDSYDPTSTIIANDDEEDGGDPCLSSTHSSPTLSHHECFQVDNTTYSAPSSPHGKQPLSRHPKKKLVRRQSSPPTSTTNADADDEPEADQAVPPDSPGTRVKFRRSFFKRFSAGNKEELQGKTRALSVRERTKVQKKTQPESKKKARRTFSVGDDQLMRIRQQQTTAKSTNSNSNIFASVKEEDEAGSPAQSSSLLPGQPVANQQESAFEDVFSPNSLTETQKKARNIARDLKDKMRFLRRRHTDSSLRDTNKFNVEKVNFPDVEDVRKWGESFENLLRDKNGLEAFRKFLQTEFSDENIEFWLACEDYKKLKSSKYATRARKIYDDYVTIQAPREVNLDSRTRLETVDNLNAPDEHTFDQAQKRIEALMEKDSYPRFLRSEIYQKILRESSKKGK
ncbi:uncharacterized protein [Diadema antillarum]|uniref:uncharacterized protein n=1 Tax=Diadema antillarum TaxID=105358 RepID=UPI003A8C24F6